MYLDRNSDSAVKVKKNLFVWGFVLFLMGTIAVGDVEQGSVEVIAGETVSASEVDVSGGGAGASRGELIQFKCSEEKDFSIRDALAMLGSMCQKNIVPTPDVDGQLAFRRLSNVTFEEAMDAILGGKFEYEQKGNLVEVYPKGDKGRMKYEVFALHYISAAEASKLITPILSSDGKIGITSAAETGVPTGESISAPKGGDTMSLKDTIVVYDYAENIRRAKEVIAAIDIRPKQVLIEATILSATLTEGMELGIDLNFQGGISLTGTPASDAIVNPVTGDIVEYDTPETTTLEQIQAGVAKGSPMEVAGFATFGGSGLRLGVRSGDVVAYISALETVTDITVLANPKILTVNKQLGQVYIGQKIGYREGDIETLGGGIQEGAVKFLDTGTKLSFRPYIGDDGYIRMDIHPKDSSGNLNAEGVPNEDSTELATNILVKDGQTIVIGGLFRDVTTTTRQQVPLLGDLPLVGLLFRKNTDLTIRQEVIVLLTCHIIEEPSETGGEARMADIRRKRFGAKESLQWVGRARLAEDHYASAARYYLEGDNESAMKDLDIALTLRPTYLEAIRLKERIIGEAEPGAEKKIERKVNEAVEQEDLDKWLRL